ncbi:hypothetical protein PoB_001883000 [Plakobranchus ocellatus]|uniref:Uncharacterized protein n=1 Tax=Plakobranchus ocellatus TaxID=259542 RepID=A0AAV3ZAZ6_9GAST|nr:hypothetical protein PoB_001883000 [Plakobranchus ocellatus]
MQQSKARNVSSRVCRAVNGVCNSKSLCLIFFRTRAMCCVPCAECHVTSMEGLPKGITPVTLDTDQLISCPFSYAFLTTVKGTPSNSKLLTKIYSSKSDDQSFL